MRCKAHATIESTNARVAKYDEAIETESQQNLIDDLDAIFSRYIRLKYANEKGIVQCFTCNKRLPIAAIQNGHFISRSNLATRFMEENCRPQCPRCNSVHNDDKQPYIEALERDKAGLAQWLESVGRAVVKPSLDELKQLIIAYRFKVKILEKKIKPTT